ncbi:MAG: hypothetical protein LQ338_008277 [Usnochroma carphineum]|nr:MAG: hypothetical protein LQ338_008277 [Usnochroma carphineum]
MANYGYQDLLPEEIRLIRFRPGTDLTADLEKSSLQKAPRYIALSYTWGRAPCRKGRPLTITYSITLNGRGFEVQENLHDALTYLAPRIRKEQCLLWVDAICINQADLQERSAQILHMKYIYEHASMVYGWLGVPRDEEETSLAIEVMTKFKRVLLDKITEANGDIYAAFTQISPSDKEIFPEPGTDCYKGWLGIREMFNRPYWGRTWIYQEVTGAPPTWFFCGICHFDTSSVSACVCMAHHFSEFTQSDARFRYISIGPVLTIQAMRKDDGFKYGDSFLDLLQQLRFTETTEPRDKVYAPLGFAVDLSSADIKPDYSKSLVEVYTDVVRFSLSRPDQGLQVLGHVMRFQTDRNRTFNTYPEPDWPTWVPDFRDNRGIGHFRPHLGDGSWAYNACGPHRVHNARIEGSRLMLTGIMIDQISELSTIWDNNFFDTATVRSWAPRDSTAVYAQTGQTMDEAFRITILADMNVVDESRGHMADLDLLDARNDCLSADQFGRNTKMGWALRSAAGRRRLCWTKNGRMGLVPPAAQVDDLLVVLLGGQMVYVVRRAGTNNVFEFVGEAYVHGIMDGEVFGTNTIGNTLEAEEIILE